MCPYIIDGISVSLHKYFGDAYKIYAETVEQGLKIPCFFIGHEDTSRKNMIGGRYFSRYSFDISYFPKEGKLEMLEIAEKLMDCLKIIELPDGSPVRGRNMRFNIANGILHFYISYSMFLEEVEVKDKMEGMVYRIL